MTVNGRAAAQFIATLEGRDWDGWAALLHPDVVYELPQSRERIRGRERYLQFNRDYPSEWHLRAKVVLADQTDGCVWFDWVVGDEQADGVVFFSFDGEGLITRVTDFWPEPYDPPSGREQLVERW